MNINEPSWLKLAARSILSDFADISPQHQDYNRMRDRLWMQYKFSRLFGRALTHAEIWGCRMRFVQFPALMRLAEEILGYRIYAFQTEAKRPFIIDLGANIGMSILFFKKMFPESRILAFEPDALNFEILSENVRANGWKDVELHNVALAGVEGEIDFFTDPAGNASLESGVYARHLPGAIKQRVKAVSLSAFVKEPVDFMKMDIEGSEEPVLQELAASGVLGNIKRMAVEYHHHLIIFEDRLSKFLGILEGHDFGYALASPFWGSHTPSGVQDILICAYSKVTK